MDFLLLKNKIALFCLGMLFLFMLLDIETTTAAAQKSIFIFTNSILPSLLPFFIISNIINNVGTPKRLNPVLYAFIMSAASGYPMGAKILNDYASQAKLNINQERAMLAFTFVTSPAFMVGTIGLEFLGSIKAAIVIMISHYIGAFINGYLYWRRTSLIDYIEKKSKNIDYEIIVESVYTSLKAMGLILAFITIFMIMIEILQHLLLESVASNSLLPVMLKGILEISIGTNAIGLTNNSWNIITLITSFLVSFGGLSVLCQGKAMLTASRLSLIDIIVIKVRHGGISLVCAFVILRIMVI